MAESVLRCTLNPVKRGHLFILLVEDDENDIFLVRKATQAGGEGHSLHPVHDGLEAIEYVNGAGAFGDRLKYPLPNVVLTDLKMPRMNGFEFLQWIRANEQFSVIPTIVYSNSQLESDIRRAYQCGANSYITKPTGLADMVEILRTIYAYWSRCECPQVPS